MYTRKEIQKWIQEVERARAKEKLARKLSRRQRKLFLAPRPNIPMIPAGAENSTESESDMLEAFKRMK